MKSDGGSDSCGTRDGPETYPYTCAWTGGYSLGWLGVKFHAESIGEVGLDVGPVVAEISKGKVAKSKKVCAEGGLNHRPVDWRASTLPAELLELVVWPMFAAISGRSNATDMNENA